MCSSGVGSRERNEQGAKHNMTAVVTETVVKGTKQSLIAQAENAAIVQRRGKSSPLGS